MAHVLSVWQEGGMTPEAKVNALTNLENIYDDAIYYMNNFVHDIYTRDESDARYYMTSNHPSGPSDYGEGCGIDATYLGGASLATILAGSLPHGAIGMMGLGSVPAMLQECDGSNGSPDMRNYFLRGAGNGINPGSTGGQDAIVITAPEFGSEGHSLTTVEMAEHYHTFDDVWNAIGSFFGGPQGPNNATRTDNTISTNGLTSVTSDPHYHQGGVFTWTGYKDVDNVHHGGSYDNRPPYMIVKYVMVR